jgi:hypothetical protein
MFDRFQKTIMVLAVLGAIAVGASALASAASKGGTTGQQGNSSGATGPQGSQTRGPGHGPGETLLTDGTADKVRQAALDKVPGATVLRVETDAQGSPYEAHLQKSDGSQVTVKVDKQFNATAVESGFGPGPRP